MKIESNTMAIILRNEKAINNIFKIAISITLLTLIISIL